LRDVRLTLIRNATLLLELEGRRLLVDPMLDAAGARPPVANTPNPRPNPLVPLPLPAEKLVRDLDAVIVTHLHRDHFDDTAAQLLPRDVPVFCQPGDASALAGLGLLARPVEDVLEWEGIVLTRTRGRHGSGETADLLGPVSGFVLDGLYIAGDTVWCPEVEEAIAAHEPRVAVVNGSGACFLGSEPLVMTVDEVREVVARVPTVVVVHLEAINHCLETRAEIRAAVPAALVPEDGETLEL
jgi:L-ascorbate metabolism protein UlaG (beta-lactamase superfamily)